MVAKGRIFVLVVTALVLRSTAPIKRTCIPSGFREFEPLMTYLDAEDTGSLLCTSYTPRRLERCEKLWRKRSLILMLLLLAGIEQNPGELS